MPERFEIIRSIKALYKYSFIFFPFLSSVSDISSAESSSTGNDCGADVSFSAHPECMNPAQSLESNVHAAHVAYCGTVPHNIHVALDKSSTN